MSARKHALLKVTARKIFIAATHSYPLDCWSSILFLLDDFFTHCGALIRVTDCIKRYEIRVVIRTGSVDSPTICRGVDVLRSSSEYN